MIIFNFVILCSIPFIIIIHTCCIKHKSSWLPRQFCALNNWESDLLCLQSNTFLRKIHSVLSSVTGLISIEAQIKYILTYCQYLYSYHAHFVRQLKQSFVNSSVKWKWTGNSFVNTFSVENTVWSGKTVGINVANNSNVNEFLLKSFFPYCIISW